MLITVSGDVKPYLGISGSTYDVQLQMYVDFILAEMSAYIDNPLEATTYSGEVLEYEQSRYDTYPVRGLHTNEGQYGLQLFLKHYPVISGVALYVDDVEVSGDRYRLDSDNGVITVYDYLNDAEDQLTATYIAGYNALPDSLKFVALEGVRYMFGLAAGSASAGGGTGDIESKKIGDFAVSYATSTNNSSASSSVFGSARRYLRESATILDRYKKISI